MSVAGRKIAEALLELEREGALSWEQRALVERRVTEALAGKGDGAGRFISILAALGGVLVGAGILYLVGYNWDQLSKIQKLAIVFGVWLSIHYVGFRLAEPPGGYPRVGRAVTSIGILCFGGAIGLVAQIYNLSSEYPNWVLAWWALSVPFVLLTESTAILLLVIALFLVWIFWHTGTLVDRFDQHIDHDFFAAFALVGAGLGLLWSSLGAWSSKSRFGHFAPVLAGLARPAAIGAAYALSFKDFWWDQMDTPGRSGEFQWFTPLHGGLHAQAFVPFAALSLAGLAALALAAWRARERERVFEGLAFFGAALALAANLWLWPRGIFLLANALLLAGILVLVYTGIRRGRPADINWGIAAFVLCVATRYVEYLWDKLEGAYAFIGIGLVLLGMGWVLERKRRKWIALSVGRVA
jgi:uncharacterized membrane protein